MILFFFVSLFFSCNEKKTTPSKPELHLSNSKVEPISVVDQLSDEERRDRSFELLLKKQVEPNIRSAVLYELIQNDIDFQLRNEILQEYINTHMFYVDQTSKSSNSTNKYPLLRKLHSRGKIFETVYDDFINLFHVDTGEVLLHYRAIDKLHPSLISLSRDESVLAIYDDNKIAIINLEETSSIHFNQNKLQTYEISSDKKPTQIHLLPSKKQVAVHYKDESIEVISLQEQKSFTLPFTTAKMIPSNEKDWLILVVKGEKENSNKIIFYDTNAQNIFQETEIDEKISYVNILGTAHQVLIITEKQRLIFHDFSTNQQLINLRLPSQPRKVDIQPGGQFALLQLENGYSLFDFRKDEHKNLPKNINTISFDVKGNLFYSVVETTKVKSRYSWFDDYETVKKIKYFSLNLFTNETQEIQYPYKGQDQINYYNQLLKYDGYYTKLSNSDQENLFTFSGIPDLLQANENFEILSLTDSISTIKNTSVTQKTYPHVYLHDKKNDAITPLDASLFSKNKILTKDGNIIVNSDKQCGFYSYINKSLSNLKCSKITVLSEDYFVAHYKSYLDLYESKNGKKIKSFYIDDNLSDYTYNVYLNSNSSALAIVFWSSVKIFENIHSSPMNSYTCSYGEEQEQCTLQNWKQLQLPIHAIFQSKQIYEYDDFGSDHQFRIPNPNAPNMQKKQVPHLLYQYREWNNLEYLYNLSSLSLSYLDTFKCFSAHCRYNTYVFYDETGEFVRIVVSGDVDEIFDVYLPQNQLYIDPDVSYVDINNWTIDLHGQSVSSSVLIQSIHERYQSVLQNSKTRICSNSLWSVEIPAKDRLHNSFFVTKDQEQKYCNLPSKKILHKEVQQPILQQDQPIESTIPPENNVTPLDGIENPEVE